MIIQWKFREHFRSFVLEDSTTPISLKLETILLLKYLTVVKMHTSVITFRKCAFFLKFLKYFAKRVSDPRHMITWSRSHYHALMWSPYCRGMIAVTWSQDKTCDHMVAVTWLQLCDHSLLIMWSWSYGCSHWIVLTWSQSCEHLHELIITWSHNHMIAVMKL